MSVIRSPDSARLTTQMCGLWLQKQRRCSFLWTQIPDFLDPLWACRQNTQSHDTFVHVQVTRTLLAQMFHSPREHAWLKSQHGSGLHVSYSDALVNWHFNTSKGWLDRVGLSAVDFGQFRVRPISTSANFDFGHDFGQLAEVELAEVEHPQLAWALHITGISLRDNLIPSRGGISGGILLGRWLLHFSGAVVQYSHGGFAQNDFFPDDQWSLCPDIGWEDQIRGLKALHGNFQQLLIIGRFKVSFSYVGLQVSHTFCSISLTKQSWPNVGVEKSLFASHWSEATICDPTSLSFSTSSSLDTFSVCVVKFAENTGTDLPGNAFDAWKPKQLDDWLWAQAQEQAPGTDAPLRRIFCWLWCAWLQCAAAIQPQT